MCKVCVSELNDAGTIVQICNCEHGSIACECE